MSGLPVIRDVVAWLPYLQQCSSDVETIEASFTNAYSILYLT